MSDRARGRPRKGRAAILALVVVVSSACRPPDASPGPERPLSADVLEFATPDTVRRTVLHPGVTYRYVWSPRGPWAIHLVEVDLALRCELALEVLQAEPREAGAGGRERVSGMVARAPQQVLAAVNADFFTPEGNALGTEIVDGKVLAAARRPTVAWRPGEAPWLGIAEVADGEVRLGWPVDRQKGDGGTEAAGGFPDLLDGGVRVGDLEVSERPSFAAARHPRTGIGYDSARGVLWMVVVDGRQVPHSAGMSLPEFAGLFEALGADEAVNLDGGGSSALVVESGPVNHPSDEEGERAVVNALALVVDPSGCVPR